MRHSLKIKLDRFAPEDRARIKQIQRFLDCQEFNLDYDRLKNIHRWQIILGGKTFACEIPDSAIAEHGFSRDLGIEIAHTILSSMLDYIKEIERTDLAKYKLWFSN